MKNMLKTIGIVALLLLVAIPLISSAAAENVSRDLSSQTVAPGDTITVTLDVNDPDDRIIIDDMVPAGWSITDAGTGDTSETDHIKWVEFGTVASTTYTYDVQVPMSASGTYNFDGDYILTSGNEASILGESEVTVTAEGNGDAMDVSRDLSSQTVTPGDTITVSLDVNNPDDRIIVDDMVPAGWSITDAGTGDTSETDHIKWVEYGGSVASTTYTYDVQVPMSASGTYNFDGDYILTSGATEASILGESEVTVTADGNGDAMDVSRDLSSQTVAPGDTITVTLDVNNPDDRIIVDEMIPSSLTLTDAGTGDTSETDHIKWVEYGGSVASTTYTYDVQVPMSATDGTVYNFDGTYILTSGQTETTITGELQATVEEDEVSATRDIMPDPAEVGPCDEFNVSITVENDGQNVSVIETLPEGFEYVSSTVDPMMVNANDEVIFTLGNAVTEFEYTVKAVGVENGYMFDGVIKDQSMAEYPVEGESQVNVVLPEGVALQPGQSLISTPYTLDNSSVDYIFMNVDTNDLVISQWNCSAEMWEPVEEMVPMRGYAVWNTGECAQVVSYDVFEATSEPNTAPPSLEICEGYNIVAAASAEPVSAEIALSSIDESWNKIITWDTDANWFGLAGINGQTGNLSGNNVGEDEFMMHPFEAYFLTAEQDDNLTL